MASILRHYNMGLLYTHLQTKQLPWVGRLVIGERFGFVCPREGHSPPATSQLPPRLSEWRRHWVGWLQLEYGATSLFNTIINDQTITVPNLKWPDNLLPLLGLFPLLLLLNPLCHLILVELIWKVHTWETDKNHFTPVLNDTACTS